jgi:short-subunit dehydrogenase
MHVAITGASRGIGEALAHRFAASGADLTLVARSAAALETLAGRLARPARVLPADLDGDPTGWVERAEAGFGPIDVLINNAGRQVVGPADSIAAEAEASLRLNLLSPVRLCLAVGPGMLARGRGTIVNVASAAAHSWLPGMAAYNASKSGLGAWSESLRAEWLPRGVNVLTVYPGPVRTDMGTINAGAYGARWIPMGTAPRLATLVERAVLRRRKRLIYPGYYWIPWFAPNLARWVTLTFGWMPGVSDSSPGPR